MEILRPSRESGPRTLSLLARLCRLGPRGHGTATSSPPPILGGSRGRARGAAIHDRAVPPSPPSSSVAPLGGRLPLAAAANVMLLGAWLLLHASTLRWLGAHFTRSPFHAGLLAVAVALLVRGIGLQGTARRALAAL